MGLFDKLFGKGQPSMLQPGEPAPDFEVPDHLGRPVRLRDLIGKRVVLWFYPKADTPG
jgi:peroxiredoxin Q/BCP